MKLKIKKLHKNAVIPFYATSRSGSFDLTATEVIMDGPNKATVKFGFAAEIPMGFDVNFKPRSSFTHKGWVMQNSPAEIDNDYRGEWIAKFEAIPIGYQQGYDNGVIGPGYVSRKEGLVYSKFPYSAGDRVLQAKLVEKITADIEEVDELSETERGTGGFGSTDVKINKYGRTEIYENGELRASQG